MLQTIFCMFFRFMGSRALTTALEKSDTKIPPFLLIRTRTVYQLVMGSAYTMSSKNPIFSELTRTYLGDYWKLEVKLSI